MDAPTLTALLHAAGFTQALLLGLYFWKGRRLPGNLYESLLLFAIALTIGFGYLYGSHKILNYPHLARFAFSFMAILGPLLFLSVRARERADNRLYLSDLSLWIVPLGITLYLLPFHLSPVETKLQYLREDLVDIHFDCIVILYLALLNNLVAISLSIARMHRTAARILRQSRSGGGGDGERGNFWFHAIPLALIIGAGALSARDPNLLNSGLFSGIAALLIVIRSYLLLFRSQDDAGADALYPPAARYQKALLSQDFVAAQGAKIQDYLDEDQPYLEPDFQLGDIARRLELSTVQTSQIINRHFQKSFLQLARGERVAAALELLRSRPASSTVLDIALESGFNSRSSFNSAFKQITGATPSDWRRQNART